MGSNIVLEAEKGDYKKLQVVAVRAIIINKSGKLLVVSDREGAEYWHLPGGWVEPLEGIFAACKREVLEETGMEIEPEKIIGIGEWFEDARKKFGNIVQKIELYVFCKIIGNEKLNMEWVDHDKGLIKHRKFISNKEWQGNTILAHTQFRKMNISDFAKMPNCYFFEETLFRYGWINT